MNTIIKNSQLTTTGRATRLAGGVGAMLAVTATQGPLGGLALVPLLATYPCFAAVFGSDPLTGSIKSMGTWAREFVYAQPEPATAS